MKLKVRRPKVAKLAPSGHGAEVGNRCGLGGKCAAAAQGGRAFAGKPCLEAGLDRTYISQVERRQRNVTIEVLARLAKALGTTADQLLIPPRKAKAGGRD